MHPRGAAGALTLPLAEWAVPGCDTPPRRGPRCR